jgi:eukaryotic-like serine/threonine-protein kinase
MAIGGESDDSGVPAGATFRAGGITELLAKVAGGPTAKASPPLNAGERVGRYEIIRGIGHGGFGAVYEAHDRALNRLVALKVLYGTRIVSPGVASEGEAAARLAHPNIAALHDAGVLEGGAPYLVYELLHGETLESRLDRGPLPPREALEIAAQVARALAHAHAAGVVHRDLKPANVFLTAEGDVKVLDFGVALLFGREGPSGGTPAYMAPEQRRGEAEDARTDLFALGILVREMVAGERAPTASERIPPPIRCVLASLLAEDPAARPRSARAALGGIEAAHRALATPRVRLRKIGFASAAAIAVAGAVAAAVLVRERLGLGTPTAATVPSIAILAFTDLSPAKDQEYFADGLSEEILNALAHVEGLHVAGRTSSFSFKGKNVPVAQIGRELHVGAVLEGSVRKEGERVRITAQIVNVADGYHLWSESFDRELTGVFAVQDEIARAVVDALEVKLMPGRAPSTKGYRTSNPEAHRQYLLGRQFWNMLSLEGDRRAIQAQEKALALDPTYAPAWAGLAMAVFDEADQTMNEGTLQEGCRRALEAAEKAVALDPELAESYSTRGFLRSACNWDWAGANTDLERALALNPGDVLSQRRYGDLRLLTGRPADALTPLRKAIEIDPLVPLTWRWLGITYMAMGEPGSAREALNRVLQILPEDPYARYLLAITFLLEAQPQAALNAVERSRDDSDRLAVLALAHHDLGQRRESQQALEALHARLANGDAYAAYDLARVHAWVGEHDRALEWLERARIRHEGDIFFVKVDPLLRDLHGDPRYVALLRKMNLTAH